MFLLTLEMNPKLQMYWFSIITSVLESIYSNLILDVVLYFGPNFLIFVFSCYTVTKGKGHNLVHIVVKVNNKQNQ